MVLDWLSGVWVLVPFVAAVLSLATIWQLRHMPDDLRQAMDHATDRARTRRLFVESLAFSALLIALAFRSLPMVALLAIMIPFLLLGKLHRPDVCISTKTAKPNSHGHESGDFCSGQVNQAQVWARRGGASAHSSALSPV